MQLTHPRAAGLVPALVSALSRRDLNPDITCPNLDTSKSCCMRDTQPPIMPDIAQNCDGFYKVSSGDQCDTIAQRHDITTAQLRSWNSEINDINPNTHLHMINCTNLRLDYYNCVHVPGATIMLQGPPEPTKETSGPTPQMAGIVNNCRFFHLIEARDSSWPICTNAGIAFAQFRS
ncbi:hypothetical protein BDV12DRAFT_209781 [Aspergillus spectabilis]